MRQLLILLKKIKSFVWRLKKNFQILLSLFLLASATMSPLFLESAISFPKAKIALEMKLKNIMSVNVPEMKFVKEEMEGSIFPYGFCSNISRIR